jgi:hypothetical protein
LDELADIVGTSPVDVTVAHPGCSYRYSSRIGPPYIVVGHFPGTVGLTAGVPVAELARKATWDDSSGMLQVQMPSGVVWVLVDLTSDLAVDPKATAIAVFQAAEGRFPWPAAANPETSGGGGMAMTGGKGRLVGGAPQWNTISSAQAPIDERTIGSGPTAGAAARMRP